MKTRGYAAQSTEKPLAPFKFERRAPGDRDVHIEIDFCGICHSDIYFARNEWGMTTFPCVPIDEFMGRTVKTEKDARKYKEGQRAGVGCFVNSCHTLQVAKARQVNIDGSCSRISHEKRGL